MKTRFLVNVSGYESVTAQQFTLRRESSKSISLDSRLSKHIDRAPVRFIQVNDGERFDPIKTCTLTGTFKLWIAAGVNPGLSPLNYPFKGDKKWHLFK